MKKERDPHGTVFGLILCCCMLVVFAVAAIFAVLAIRGVI